MAPMKLKIDGAKQWASKLKPATGEGKGNYVSGSGETGMKFLLQFPPNPSNLSHSLLEIGSPSTDKIFGSADPDPAGEITAELKASSLQKRGRSDKASVPQTPH